MDNIYDPFDQANFTTAPKGAFDTFDVLYGHHHFGVHEKLTRPFKYITFLREPIKRLMSNWWYIRTHNTHRHYKEALAAKNVVDFYDMQVEPWGENGMTKMLAGVDPRTVPLGAPCPALLAKALQNLSGFTFVGDTAQMEKSLVILRQTLNWNTIPFCPSKQNMSQNKPELTEEDIKGLKKYVSEDEMLYKTVALGTTDAVKTETEQLQALHKLALQVIGALRGKMHGTGELNLWAKAAVELYKERIGEDEEAIVLAESYVNRFV